MLVHLGFTPGGIQDVLDVRTSDRKDSRALNGDADDPPRTDAPRLHVAWDMTHAGRIRTGVGGYARNVISTIETSGGARVTTLAAPRLLDGRAGLPAKTLRGLHQVMWTQLGLRAELRKLNPDVFHAPAFISGLWTPCRTVITIHDASFIHLPQQLHRTWRWYMKTLVPLVARRADAIIAVSEHARNDIELSLTLPVGKVHAVYPGVDHRRFRRMEARETEAVARKYNLSRPFVLHVGNLAARKNITTLLHAVFLLKQAGSWGERKVALAGGTSVGMPGYDDIRAAIERLGLADEVLLLGHVPDDDLPAIYNLAEVVVMPTLYEGFGSPVVEAMACGRPVVASNCSSLPEVTGDAALLVEPTDSEAWADALSRVFTDEGLQRSMAERGLLRARRFTWEKTAEETLQVYRSVLHGANGSGAAGEARHDGEASS